MSTARIEQLKSLLHRVQERREQPRLRAVGASAERISGEVRVGEAEPLRLSEVMPTQTRAALPTPQLTEAQVREAFTASAPSVLEALPPVVLGVERPNAAAEAAQPSRTAQTLSDIPALAVQASDDPEITTSFDSEPPTGASVIPPATAELLTAPSQRVEAPLIAKGEPVARVVSAPRVDAPKNFGDLLEGSLSLRPR